MTMFKLTTYEKRNYLMKDDNDWIILSKIKALEKKHLSPKDKKIINLIRTQLKKEWRIPLIRYLDNMSRRYKK